MWKKIKNLFKKKEEIKIIIPKPKIDFSDIKFELNIKSICYFEKITGLSFYEFTEDYIIELFYSIFIVNNPSKTMTLSAFTFLIEREDVAMFFSKSFTECSDMISQIPTDVSNTQLIEGVENTQVKKITDYATTLIVEYGMDIDYVMYKMSLWELNSIFEAIDAKVKKDLINQRFWAYINIMPHIDTKKVKTPQMLIPFEWEKEEIKNAKERELKNNMFAIKNMIGKSIFGDKDGKE